MLNDNKRVRAALRAGAQPVQNYGRDSTIKRPFKPDSIANGPDGDVITLVRFGHNEQREVKDSRGQYVQKRKRPVLSASKAIIIGKFIYVPNC